MKHLYLDLSAKSFRIDGIVSNVIGVLAQLVEQWTLNP